uniref:Fanconi anemia group I protein-like isoform X2 n=1 Tax=Styela clava TaxID=7725 RepID=UPI00193A7A59|nr:Fanconi anemia group I protein-like isoform X2 [Styela clava]
MDEQLLKLFDTDNFEELSQKLREITIEQLKEFVDDHILRHKNGSEESTKILRAIFKGCNSEKNHLSLHTIAVFTHCLKFLSSPDVSQNTGTDILGIILFEIDKLTTGGLVDASKMIIEMIRNGNTGHGRAIQVLPKLLTCIEQKNEVYIGADQGSMSGSEYKKHLINNLCSGKWSSRSIIHLANIFKDVSMSIDEMRFFLQKMLRQLERLEIQEIPPLVHQILPLSGKTNHDIVLQGIFHVFTKLDKKSLEEQRKSTGDSWNEMFEIEENVDYSENNGHATIETSARNLKIVEGTVILHLTNMARWDQTLGKVFIKMLKMVKDSLAENSLSVFFLAVALILSQIKIFREQILEQLKVIIFRCFSHEHRHANSNWLKQRLLSVPDVKKSLQSVLDSCKHSWEQVVTGIVRLGLCLLDAYGPKSAFGRIIEGIPAREDTPQQNCCDLGAYLLANVFKSHPVVRTEIIEQLLNRVITKMSSPINHYIDVLKGICKHYSSIVLESKQKLREFFERICLLSPQNAACVLHSILPLIRINSHLKDSLILVLRKALFSCQINGRIIACDSFLLLLQDFRVEGFVSLSQASSQSSQSMFSMSSQIHVDVHNSSTDVPVNQSSNHESLCLEVLSTLRRCLTQQSPVRATLYKGLWNVILYNPHLARPILEKLITHFNLYHEEHAGVIPPIKPKICITVQNGEPTLLEPLSLLLSSMFLCMKKGQERQGLGGEYDKDEIIDQNILITVNELFESITTRMVKSEMEDFELDKSADFSNSTSVGKNNYILGNLVMGCYQSLFEYAFLQDDLNEKSANTILQLHVRYKKIKDVINSGRKDSNKSSASSFSASPVFIKSLIDGLFCDESTDREVGLNILRMDDDFVKYAAETAISAVVDAKEHDLVKGIGGNDKNLLLEMCMTVGRACLKKFMELRNDPTASAICHSCLDAFFHSLQYIYTRKRKRLEEFLMSVSMDRDAEGTAVSANAQVRLVRRFQRIIIAYLSEDVALSSAHRKILPLLASVVDFLSSTSFYDFTNNVVKENPIHSSTPYPNDITQTNKWIGKLCQEQIIDDAAVTKSLISLHLHLCTICGPCTGDGRAVQGSEGAIHDIAEDVRVVAGDIENTEGEDSTMVEERKRGSHYQIIDECNVIILVPILVSHMDSTVEETEWLLQRLKGLIAANLTDEKFEDSTVVSEIVTDFDKKRTNIESSICSRLGIILNSYRELILSSLPLGQPAECTFHGLSKLYNLLTHLAKYYTWLLSQNVIKSLPPCFEKLVKLIGTEVTRFIYPFINYIESMQTNRTSQDAKKRKRKDNNKDSTRTAANKMKVLRETRFIPSLIYSVENLERFLISLGKKCKMDLLREHKLPTSRDFRIKSSVIKETLARREEEVTQETQEEISTNSSDEGDSARKKPRSVDK